jgi:hypothetical protein
VGTARNRRGPHRRRTLLAPETRDLMQRLVIHYRGAVPAGEVIRCVVVAQRALRRAGIDDVGHLEDVARHRLAQRCVPAPRVAPGLVLLLGLLEPIGAVLG